MKKNLNQIAKLRQQKNEKISAMEALTDKALQEERAFSDDEKAEFENLENEVRALNDTIAACEKDYEKGITHKDKPDDEQRAAEEAEVRAFVSYIRGEDIDAETRAASNWTMGENGAVVPKRIVNKVIEEIEDRCNIYAESEHFNTGGTLVFPEYDESDGGISVAYQDEFKALTSTSGKFKAKELKGYLAGALTKVSKSLINNTDFNVFDYIVHKMGEAGSNFLEKELLVGTANKIEGLSTAEVVGNTISADGLIDLQDSIKQIFQPNCKWRMNSKTKNKIRKFKDNEGNYLLVRDYTKDGSNYMLLGKPVELTDNLDDDVVIYGDASGLKTKIVESANIEVLREKFADEHAVGVVLWLEIDSKLLEKYKVKMIKPSASTGA